jgi:hypothetical protein
MWWCAGAVHVSMSVPRPSRRVHVGGLCTSKRKPLPRQRVIAVDDDPAVGDVGHGENPDLFLSSPDVFELMPF